MRNPNCLHNIFTAALLIAASAAPALAQNYPVRPIRFLVPFAPGGGNDFVARLVAQKLSASLDQQVIVDNRAAAGGILATDMVAKAPPDGYTVLLGFVGPMAISPGLSKVPYDPLKDFTTVSLLARSYQMLVVHPSLPARDIKQLVALAKARPNDLNYASGGAGSPLHLAGELFKLAAGVQLAHIPYKGSSPAATAVLSGEAQVLFGGVASSLPLVKAAKLRALGVTSPVRLGAAPKVPTFAEAGLAAAELASWYGLVAPPALPDAITRKLNTEIVKIVQAPDYRTHMVNQGLEAAMSTPEEFARILAADVEKWAKVIKSAGIKAE